MPSVIVDKPRSFYLEFLRIVSALYVFIYHFGDVPIQINCKAFLAPSTFNSTLRLNLYGAHFFVLIFFVLSGFLITMSLNKEGLTFKEFFIARSGRMYSVMLPALIFTYVSAYIISHYYNDLVHNNDLFVRFFVNLFFLSQSWNFSAAPPVNGPFWSISYEFLYYLILGSLLLIKKSNRYLAFIFFIVIAGPKIILLFPCWLAGSVVFYCIKSKRFFNPSISLILFIITVTLIIHTVIFPTGFPFLKGTDENNLLGYNLYFSWNFLADYIFCIIAALNIHSFFGFSEKLIRLFEKKSFQKLSEIFKKIGNCTFTMYLFHMPLMLLLATIFPYDRFNIFHNVLLIITVLIIVFFIARVTEWRVNEWRKGIGKVFVFLEANKIVKKVKSLLN